MLADLERRLQPVSHSDEAIQIIMEYCRDLGSTRARITCWNAANAIVRKPIQIEEAIQHGFDKPDDRFVLLQGDIVRTDSAYNLGSRIVGYPKYAVLNSSCDLVPRRSTTSLLLPIADIKRNDQNAKEKLSQLVKFSRRDSMYIPPLPDDPQEIVGSEMQFDGICQIRQADLLLASRVASLSLLGWRMFGSFSRVVMARSNPREVEIRAALEPKA